MPATSWSAYTTSCNSGNIPTSNADTVSLSCNNGNWERSSCNGYCNGNTKWQ